MPEMEEPIPCKYARFANADAQSAVSAGSLVLADPVDGCSELLNKDETRGAVVVFRRGGCEFGHKALAAAAVGALAVVVIDKGGADRALILMKTEQPAAKSLMLPVVSISQDHGERVVTWLSGPSPPTLKMKIIHKKAASKVRAIWMVEQAEKWLGEGLKANATKLFREAMELQVVKYDTLLLGRILAGIGEIEHNNVTQLNAVAEQSHALERFRIASQQKIKSEVTRLGSSYCSKAGAPCRKLAVFTHVRDEAIFLPLWIQHYRKQTNEDNLFILDHGSVDGSTSHLTTPVIVVENGGVHDHHFLRDNVITAQKMLLKYYEYVLFAESDEFVLADPSKYPSLVAYVDAKAEDTICALGWQPIQLRTEEAMDWAAVPLLMQRSQWIPDRLHSKPLLTRVPLNYSFGFHRVLGVNFTPDEDLVLVHFHRIDYELTRKRHKAFSKMKWNTLEKAAGMSSYQLIHEGDAFDKWYYETPDTGAETMQLSVITESIRTAL
jgi:hypothetical protein